MLVAVGVVAGEVAAAVAHAVDGASSDAQGRARRHGAANLGQISPSGKQGALFIGVRCS